MDVNINEDYDEVLSVQYSLESHVAHASMVSSNYFGLYFQGFYGFHDTLQMGTEEFPAINFTH